MVHFFVVLDSDGDRLLAKYYDGRTKAEQTAFEQVVNKKTRNVPAKVDGKLCRAVKWQLRLFFIFYYRISALIAEAILLDHEVVVFRSSADCKFFVCGSSMEVAEKCVSNVFVSRFHLHL